jgi:hypothetical protein
MCLCLRKRATVSDVTDQMHPPERCTGAYTGDRCTRTPRTVCLQSEGGSVGSHAAKAHQPCTTPSLERTGKNGDLASKKQGTAAVVPAIAGIKPAGGTLSASGKLGPDGKAKPKVSLRKLVGKSFK